MQPPLGQVPPRQQAGGEVWQRLRKGLFLLEAGSVVTCSWIGCRAGDEEPAALAYGILITLCTIQSPRVSVQRSVFVFPFPESSWHLADPFPPLLLLTLLSKGTLFCPHKPPAPVTSLKADLGLSLGIQGCSSLLSHYHRTGKETGA